jgi:hypothetical protein
VTKHTPGPWVANYRGTVGHIKSIAENPNGFTPTVARFDIGALSIPDDEKMANAQLIAAAPDLLAVSKKIEACVTAYEKREDYPFAMEDWAEELRAAIAKATTDAQPQG